jgi:hypothetical protein
VLGVIEPSSIIVVFLAQLVQWLSLTHSLTCYYFVLPSKIRHVIGFENEWYAAAPYRPPAFDSRLIFTVKELTVSSIFQKCDFWKFYSILKFERLGLITR